MTRSPLVRSVSAFFPCYNDEHSISVMVHDVRRSLVGAVDDFEIIVVDDGSTDGSFAVLTALAAEVPELRVIRHEVNRGYGGNQKTCYRLALEAGADIIIMVHPDYQYTPKLIPAMAGMVSSGLFSVVLGSRILGGQALSGGMPLWRYVSNRALTLAGNLLLGTKVSEFHTGYRAFSRELLERLPLAENSDDFVFDNQMLAQAVWFGYRIGEVSCPTRYAPESSSATFLSSVRYGFGCLGTALLFRLCKWGLAASNRFPKTDRQA
jgi:glycosyltransferase involved in cell wall biosynthesis